ncbi:MAG: ParB-like nuclease domain-containing protein [Deltaproteobacteria bacterium]|nr:ParB-like nuclease domain-containing protein [Deltaproteobacteria bacterium]
MNVLNKLKDGPHFSVDELIVNRGVVIEELRIDEIDLQDDLFAVHPDGDDAMLDRSLSEEGQLDPIVVRRRDGRWQLVDGFRRVRAARRLGIEKLIARKFDLLADKDAAMWVLKNITVELPMPDALSGFANRLSEAGQEDAAELVRRYAEAIQVVEEEAPAEAPVEAAAEEEQEVTVEDLAAQTVSELSAAAENLQLVQENWADVAPEQREEVLAQLRYYGELLAFLEAPPAEEASEEAPVEAAPSDEGNGTP